MDHDEPPLKRSRGTSSSTQPSAFANPDEFVQRAQNVSVPLPRTPEQPVPAQPDGRQGGGASDHWLQYRTHHISDAKRPSNVASKSDFPTRSKSGLPQKLETVSAQSSRLVSLQNEITESPATTPLQPPRCNGQSRGVYSVLRSDVEQRSFAHTVSRSSRIHLNTAISVFLMCHIQCPARLQFHPPCCCARSRGSCCCTRSQSNAN